MSQKWNLQDIRPAENKPRRRPPQAAPRPAHDAAGPSISLREPETPDQESEVRSIPIQDGNRKKRKQTIIAGAFFVFIIGGGLLISALTGGAEITVYPKYRDLTLSADFTTYRERQPGELNHELLTLEATGERQVSATGQQQIQSQAQGEIEIKKSTPGTERLIKNTRFETSDGLVFRIEESVVVPGAVTTAAGETAPGTIRAKVFADQPGEEYNVTTNTSFTVPGFAEGGFTDLFNAITAEATSDFSGGFDGPQFIIDEGELSAARQSLQIELRNSLLEKINQQRPADFVLFEDAVAITYEQLPAVEYGDDLVTIREQAVLQVPLFQTNDFASFIAQESIVGYSGEPVRIDNFESLRFTYAVATTSQSNLANLPELPFTITGNPRIVWTFDEEQMRLDLVGKEKTALVGILGQYPGLERGEVKVRPFWKQTFPKELKHISIQEVLLTD